jgi:hypothetical protein
LTDDIYKKISSRIEADWYPYHDGEWFTHDDICRHFLWDAPDIRQTVSKKLYHDSKEMALPKLEKKNKAYRLVDHNLRIMDLKSADPNEFIDVDLPYGYEDATTFGLDAVRLRPKAVVVVAGETNAGKSTWCLNFLILNLSRHKIFYYTNEWSEGGFKDRLQPFESWGIAIYDENGNPNFTPVDQVENYQDGIMQYPDAIHIVDYLEVNDDGEAYKIAPTIKHMQSYLKGGMLVVAIQKPFGRDYGVGGYQTKNASSLYLAIGLNEDKSNYLKVVKAKDWRDVDPNGKKYKFMLVDRGSKFHHIEEMDDFGFPQYTPKKVPPPQHESEY